MRALVRGDAGATPRALAVRRRSPCDHAAAAAELIFGWDGDGPRAGSIRRAPSTASPPRARGCSKSHAAVGDSRSQPGAPRRCSVSITRWPAPRRQPAATCSSAAQSGPIDARGRRIWWVDGVAMVTDGESLLADDSTCRGRRAGSSCCPGPTSSWPTARFAGAAAGVGLEVVAFADLDAVALAVAAWRGMAVRVVPLDEHRAPARLRPAPGAAGRKRSQAPVPDPVASRTSSVPRVTAQPRIGPVGRLLQHRPHGPTLPTAESGTGMEGVSQWRSLSPRRGS